MGMKVGRGTLGRMVRLQDQCILRIKGADDPEAAAAVLARLPEIAPAGVNFVSEVMVTPDGPLVLMDAKVLSRAQLGQLLERLVEAADEVDLGSGTLEVPRDGRLVEDLTFVRSGVVGAVIPHPYVVTAGTDRTIPEGWLEVAASWLRGAAFEPLVVEIVGVEARIGWDDLDDYLRVNLESGFRVSCGSVATGLRTVCGVPGYARLSFLAVHEGWSLSEQTQEANDLVAHVRRCASLAASGYVAATGRPRAFGLGEIDVLERDVPGDGFQFVYEMSDVQLIDAYWYQFLGPGHLERTGLLPGARDLGDGKVELMLGDFPEWLESERAAQLRAEGRTMLAPCFFSVEQALALRRQRRG